MKIIKNFIKDQMLFIVVYFLTTGLIIAFYSLTVANSEIIYPALIVVFFFVIYMIIRGVQYWSNYNNLKKLQNNEVQINSTLMEYKQAYNTISDIYSKENTIIASLRHENIENNRFISAYIHNLKTPVTVISIITQRVESGELRPEEAVAQISEEVVRLTNNLNMLLDIKRLEEHSKDYAPLAVCLDKEVTRCINENKSLFINFKVYPKFEEKDHMVYMDTKWNSLLINQIISNGVKYSAGTEPRHLYFSINESKDRTLLKIKDEGPGIPEYDIPHIFEAFYTGSNGRKGYSSSGIGLYLCKQICEKMGYKISIKNNNGCEVTISYLTKL